MSKEFLVATGKIAGGFITSFIIAYSGVFLLLWINTLNWDELTLVLQALYAMGIVSSFLLMILAVVILLIAIVFALEP